MGKYLFHPVTKFPTPNMSLILKLEDGSLVHGSRKKYASSYKDDPNFTDDNGNKINNVVQWAHA